MTWFLDFFRFVSVCTAKMSFRIFPGVASWLAQDLYFPVTIHESLSTEMFTSPIQLIFNNTVWYLVI